MSPAKEQTQATRKTVMDRATQVLLPGLTITGFTLTSLKKPDYGLLFNLFGQIFWLYSGWLAWRKAGQLGILIAAIFITLAVVFGVINYWILS